LPSDEKTVTRVIKYLRKSLGDLSEVLQDTVDTINDFGKSLKKAENDIKGVKVVKGKTVSSSSVKLTPEVEAGGTAKTQAASTLFALLGGAGGKTTAVPSAAATPSAPISGPPKRPGPPVKKGPPSGPPTKAGPPTNAGPPINAGPPSKNLPPPPKLPPAPGKAGPPSKAGPVVSTPSFAKRSGPPAAPSLGTPPTTPSPTVASQAGGSLSTLRDEMLDELNRLKKIMRGD